MTRSVNEARTTSRTVGPSRSTAGQGRARRALVAVELLTGGSALLCGVLMVIRPDGSLLGLPADVLAASPFTSWRLPGLLLAGFVGVGFLVAADLVHHRHRYARRLSALAGVGLVVFEVVEWAWLGFQPLQAVFIVVGAAVVGLALPSARRP